MVLLIVSSLALYGSLTSAQELDRDKARREMALWAVEAGVLERSRTAFFHFMNEGKIVEAIEELSKAMPEVALEPMRFVLNTGDRRTEYQDAPPWRAVLQLCAAVDSPTQESTPVRDAAWRLVQKLPANSVKRGLKGDPLREFELWGLALAANLDFRKLAVLHRSGVVTSGDLYAIRSWFEGYLSRNRLSIQSKDKQFYLWLKMHTPTERPKGEVVEISEAEQREFESAWAEYSREQAETQSDRLAELRLRTQRALAQLEQLRLELGKLETRPTLRDPRSADSVKDRLDAIEKTLKDSNELIEKLSTGSAK